MSYIVGKEGKAKLNGTDLILETNAFSYSEETDEIEVLAMGQPKRYAGGSVSGSGSISCNFDPDDTTGQRALIDKVNAADQTVDLELLPEGDGVPYFKLSGTVTVLGWELTQDAGSIVGVTFNFRGKLTASDVTS